MIESQRMDSARWVTAIALCLGGIWTLLINGAIPHAGMPTLGQAASMLGYSQDFANRHWYTLHGYSFGYPTPVALATGLPLAVLAGWFLRIGLSPADAYTATVMVWLLVGFMGAYRFACRLGSRGYLPALAAAAWMSLPMVWAHQSYSSLALGMALLPLYVSSAYALVNTSQGSRRGPYDVAEFVVLCVIALFMDGYTFMMFALGACLLFGLRVVWPLDGDHRKRLLTLILPAYVLGFLAAWLSYTRYMGRSGFESAPLGVFRGWAVDLDFIVRPTQGSFWFWDVLGWGQVRSGARFFGDASVWGTTFALPLVLLAAYALWSMRRSGVRIWLWMGVALAGFYLSLGPQLKVATVKPDAAMEQTMPASAGLMPTGSEWLSTHVPGFRSMRAAYRWEALFLLGLWGIVVLRTSLSSGRHARGWAVAYLAVILLDAPHMGDLWKDYRGYREGLESIDSELAVPMSSKIRRGERVLMLPFNNDVMVNYLAPKLGIRAFNVGGDKQIEIARPAWPATLRRFGMGTLEAGDLPLVGQALIDGDVDVVILPYFHSLWSAHLWPCVSQAKGYSAVTLALFAENRDFTCPSNTKAMYASLVDGMRKDETLTVDDGPLFATIRLKPAYRGAKGREEARALPLKRVRYPISVATDPEMDLILGDGWYAREPVNRWSGSHASLTLPLPAACRSTVCRLELSMVAFAASGHRPVDVVVKVIHGQTLHNVFQDEATQVISLAVSSEDPVIDVSIDVPGAASPHILGMSADERVLGASLLRIDVRPDAPHLTTDK